MNKYYLSEVFSNEKYTGIIVNEHMEYWLDECGYTPIKFGYSESKDFTTQAIRLVKLLFWTLKIPKKSIVLFHFPITPQAFRIFIRLLKLKGVYTTALVHDLNGLRKNDYTELKREEKYLSLFDHVIVHNHSMLEFLKKNITLKNTSIIKLFDYKVTENRFIECELNLSITIAGNLEKATYIPQLLTWAKEHLDTIIFVYGNIPNELNIENASDNLLFKGAVPPEELPLQIQGSFGIVWDGDSIDTCSGYLGNYLRYNSPHKLSMYLAAGIPVIVWEQSAMREWVINNKVGIVVNSWSDAANKIRSMDSSTYVELCIQSKKIATRLRKGEFLKKVLNEVEMKAFT